MKPSPMKPSPMQRARFPRISSVHAVLLAATLLAPALLLIGCGGGGGGGSSPTAPPPPNMNPGSASFRVVGGGSDTVVSYGGGGNLVFCRTNASWADLWIRFARDVAADGENGPHLDIDLCNLGDGGTFAPMDPQAAVCGGGKTWDVWWHGENATYVNTASAPACTLGITRDGNQLTGNFSCQGLAEMGGTRTVDVLDGTFQCTVE